MTLLRNLEKQNSIKLLMLANYGVLIKDGRWLPSPFCYHQK